MAKTAEQEGRKKGWYSESVNKPPTPKLLFSLDINRHPIERLQIKTRASGLYMYSIV